MRVADRPKSVATPSAQLMKNNQRATKNDALTGMAQPSSSNGSCIGTKGVGLPLSYTTCQYFGGRRAGVCFAQVQPSSTRYVEWIERHLPCTTFIVVTTGKTLVGRHSVQGVDREGAEFASARTDQQTEQLQSIGCG
ncbi:hypothetical protein D3C78_1434650 [compost metagenome]